MTARSPTAYLLSAVVHVLAVLTLIVFAWAVQQQSRPPVKIFELVAGAGNNWMATEAPALGTPDGVKVNVPPAPPAPKIEEPAPTPPAPITPAPEPVPVTPAPEPTPPAVKSAAKSIDGTVPDFARLAKKTVARQELKQAQKQRMEEANAAAKARKEAAEAKKRMTKEQYDKLYGGKANPAGKAGATRIARIDAKGIREGVEGGTGGEPGAGGKALSRAESSIMDGYFSFLKQKLEEAHEPPVGVSDKLSVRVEFMLAVDGSISRVRIVRPSGNTDFDQSVLTAFKRVQPIGVRPDGKSEMITLEFNTRDEN
jgi:colicin import membrane protein